MKIGEFLKAKRIEAGLSVEEVGRSVGVSKSTVSKWETGDIANMRIDRVEALAKTLHANPLEIIGWSEEESTDKDKHLTQVTKLINALDPVDVPTAVEFLKLLVSRKERQSGLE